MMKKYFFSILAILLSQSFALLLLYFQFPFNLLYAIIVLLILLLIFLQKFTLSPRKKNNSFITWLFIFCSSMMVSLLVFTTGGIYSSFFILLHFYAFALAIFFSMLTSFFFIALSIVALGIQSFIDPRLKNLLLADPSSLALYFFSYLIIVPFSYFLAQQYQLKSKFTSLLEKEVQVNNIILQSINELIIITNLDMKVLSTNDSVGQNLSLSKYEMVGKNIFDVLFLRSSQGSLVNKNFLNLELLINSKQTQSFTELLLYAKNKAPFQINLLVKPVVDIQGITDQITFILTDIQTPQESHNLESAIKELQTKQQAMLELFKDKLIANKNPSLASEVYLIQNLNKDILLSHEMKDLPLESKTSTVVDIAQLSNSIVIQYQEFTHLLNVLLSFKLVNFTYADIASHVPKGMVISPMQMTSSYFSVSLPVKWFDHLLNKLLFIAILLNLSSPNKRVDVLVDRYDEEHIRIRIVTEVINWVAGDELQLFIKGFDKLAEKTHLYLASGLEGVLVQRISQQLGIIISNDFDAATRQLSIQLLVQKKKSE